MRKMKSSTRTSFILSLSTCPSCFLIYFVVNDTVEHEEGKGERAVAASTDSKSDASNVVSYV